MRQLTVNLNNGRSLDVHYVEPQGRIYEILWYPTAGVKLSDAECWAIEAACLHDLIERRDQWRRALRERRENAA